MYACSAISVLGRGVAEADTVAEIDGGWGNTLTVVVALIEAVADRLRDDVALSDELRDGDALWLEDVEGDEERDDDMEL